MSDNSKKMRITISKPLGDVFKLLQKLKDTQFAVL